MREQFHSCNTLSWREFTPIRDTWTINLVHFCQIVSTTSVLAGAALEPAAKTALYGPHTSCGHAERAVDILRNRHI